jgi:geranylgeranyl diphosphate synthase type II
MLSSYLKTQAKVVDKALERFLPKAKQSPSLLHEAIRYSVFGPGKRIRPIMTLAVSEMCGGSLVRALIPACAVEMIHSSSLVHDDLPSMDNDDYRRGRLTCHKKYGEAYAILVGDSLLIEAFHLLSFYPDPKKASRLIQVISEATGSRGMVGGQTLDKMFEGKSFDLPTLNMIHVNKTGKLFVASCLAGAISTGISSSLEKRVRRFGEYIGFAFQIIDDIIDRDGYLNFMSESEARKEVARLTGKAQAELKPFGRKAKILCELADFLGIRKK